MFSAQGIVKPKRLEFDKKTKTDFYGKFTAGPFERGYGTTIGNSLRRMLLSSVEGAAVVAVKFEGVYHEFSSIPGVVEDVTEIILNLKQLNLRLAEGVSEKRLYLRIDGSAEIKAGNITPDGEVTILNPDLHIASMDVGGKIDLEMIVRRGRGYASAEQHVIEDESVQMIPIDSVFSPVEKITYTVENTRVGQSADYDSLVMEMWTNGGITPEDAVAHAAKIVKDHMQIFINFDEEPEPAVPQVDEKHQKTITNLAKSVEELELSVRSYNCLKNANIQTIAELVQKTDGEMLKTRNFGRKSLNEIKEILEDMGLHLGIKVDDEDLKQISQLRKKREVETEVES
ncbi:MAG: DNA-directed RNA polymerase subunit alpha [Nitrospinae bacterium CG11_big_fil_rev_8_21_14_0_20_45_15]|nr:MAG: DNA-directed RNA polymerase subunit alpha [Nitrospinae bacterium CG11_big_fil_rev_8_21_14_0_20_45_15]